MTEYYLHVALNWFMLLYPLALYLDASHQKIGKVEGEKWPNFSAAGYAFLSCLFIWIAIPVGLAYLWKRKKLIERAKKAPVVDGIIKKLLIVFGLLLLRFVAFATSPELIGKELSDTMSQLFGLGWML